MTNTLPEGFLVLSQHIPSVVIDLKYGTHDNLIGRPLRGYAPDSVAILTVEAAASLHKIVQYIQTANMRKLLKATSPTFLIWDAYRPQMASEDLWEWSLTSCEKTKPSYYPNVNKQDFFELGYVARKSSHSRGSTVDLTLIDAVNGQPIHFDMGTPFDFMDPLSHPGNKAISLQAFQNRQCLKQLMEDFGWQGIEQEWWHFTFKAEPYPDTYFNFLVDSYDV